MLKISNVKIKADVKVNKEILAKKVGKILSCLLYTSDAADEL